jgi:hypothetical protein
MINVLNHYEAQNLIAFIALILAYLAYRKSIVDEFKNWINLIKSFLSELNYASSWIGNSYSSKDPNWSNPTKIVYPLTFESVKALIQKGHPPFEIIKNDFFNNLAIFNERIQAFNHILVFQVVNYTCNKLNDQETKNKAQYLNEILHLNFIGDRTNQALFWLYQYFEREISIILVTWKNKIPFYLKYPKLIVFLGLITYLIIDFII